jgi:phosphate transport system substrate-binding protein
MMKNKSLRMMKRDVEAISPVVATLLLVLVAVAAATAFFVFESNWQTQQTDKVGNVDIDAGAPYTLKVSGSTPVYEFMAPAAEAYMDEHQNAQVTVDGIGSGAGINAILKGPTGCDIGMISKDWATDSNYASHPEIKATTIAYDAAVIIMDKHAMATHQISAQDLTNMTRSIIADVYNGTIATWGDLADALNTPVDHSADTAGIVTYQRTDESGTEECFNTKVLFGASGQISLATDKSVQGNQGMIDAIKGDANGIGFTSLGMANSNSADIAVFDLNGVHAEVKTVKAEMSNPGTGYAGSRPLQVLVNTNFNEKSAQIDAFMAFILEAGNNIEFCADGGYISIYS